MSSENPTTTRRRYELRRRADAMAATRERITEAAVELHETLGPARTTISAIAERAGVQRHTVYRHFPTEDDLLDACSSHWSARNPPPRAGAWRAIADPARRLEQALDDLYAYYERTEGMLVSILRDEPVVAAVAERTAPFRAFLDDAAGTLAGGWPARGRRRGLLTAAARHAVDFQTWRSLARDGGLERAEAVELAAALVRHAATRA